MTGDGYCVGLWSKHTLSCHSYLEWVPADRVYRWLAPSMNYACHFTLDVAVELADKVGGVIVQGIRPPNRIGMPEDDQLQELMEAAK